MELLWFSHKVDSKGYTGLCYVRVTWFCCYCYSQKSYVIWYMLFLKDSFGEGGEVESSLCYMEWTPDPSLREAHVGFGNP